jgi:repressor LexA
VGRFSVKERHIRSKNPEYFKLLEDFIDTYQEKNGVILTSAEISGGTGLSTATVSGYIVHMRTDGRIEQECHRNIRTVKMRQKWEETQRVPVL